MKQGGGIKGFFLMLLETLIILVFGNNYLILFCYAIIFQASVLEKIEIISPKFTFLLSGFSFFYCWIGIGAWLIWLLEKRSSFLKQRVERSIFFCYVFVSYSLLMLNKPVSAGSGFILLYFFIFGFFALFGVRNFILSINSKHKVKRSFLIMVFLCVAPVVWFFL